MCGREKSVDWVKARERNYPLATENKLKGERGAKVELEKSEGERERVRERIKGKKEEEGAEWRREENPKRERWNRRNAVTRMLHRASEEDEDATVGG